MAQKAQNKSKKETFLQCLHNNLGHISNACISANIPRRTFYNWIDKDKDFKDKVDEVGEALVDHVESKLMQKINDLDSTCIIFYLKCKGKSRGYREKTEIELARPIKEINFDKI